MAPAKVRTTLASAVDQALWRAPSLLFLDDLHQWLPAPAENADSSGVLELCHFVCEQLERAQGGNVTVVASAPQQNSLHPLLNQRHVFCEKLKLLPPDREQRKEIIRTLMREVQQGGEGSFADIDVVELAFHTEGFVGQDFRQLFARALHFATVRALHAGPSPSSSPLVVTVSDRDLDEARAGFTPAALTSVKLQTSAVSWTDIGGLNEAKDILLETLEWPTKFSVLFRKCPLRLRSGLLLYGPPGCGKTLLASAIAKESGVNFVSIKGPELLNKYIGASEQATRDLFERAQAAKPCLLFFDEFDSIAPRRGHDSTGVTDRVVNQLLTQMDGAEGLEGVFVLAATSRPDLIDPALLRPGRLDKLVYCGMPTHQERADILRTLARKMTLESPSLLDGWEHKTEHFSGADLQAFLYNAQLEAIHQVLELKEKGLEAAKEARSKEGPGGEERGFLVTDFQVTQGEKGEALVAVSTPHLSAADRSILSGRLLTSLAPHSSRERRAAAAPLAKEAPRVVITAECLEKAFKGTRPSIGAKERGNYDAIYGQFRSERAGGIEPPQPRGGKRATLA